MDFQIYQQECAKRVEQYLSKLLFHNSAKTEKLNSPLQEALLYSVLNGGKRMRPLFVYATAEAFLCENAKLDIPAAAVELIHCYSLIHDDLPAMDNDDLRRGKPSCHKAFNEATAILAGDALLTLAFQLLSDPSSTVFQPAEQIQMIHHLAVASGSLGMVLGQTLDIAAEGLSESMDLESLCLIHQKKTGALIEASVVLGAIASGCDNPLHIAKLREYAQCVGLAFQVQDDILDVIATTETLGKKTAKDAIHKKATFPSLLGLEPAKAYATTLLEKALEALSYLGTKTVHLEQLAEFSVHRSY